MRKNVLAWCALLGPLSCGHPGGGADPLDDGRLDKVGSAVDPLCADASGAPRFCDHKDVLPASYLARPNPVTFKLSQAFPTALPAIDPPVLDTWNKVDFTKDPDRYLFALRSYFFKSLGVFIPDMSDPACVANKDSVDCSLIINPEFDTRAEDDPTLGQHGDLNGVTKVFNVPFMENVAHPREGIHGMTEERHPVTHDLDPTNPSKGTLRSYGVAYYNKRGGYTLGQVFLGPDGKPSTRPDPAKGIFADHAGAMKLLFSSGTPDQVSWLKDSFAWEVHPDRAATDVMKVRLMQIDVAMKDSQRTLDTGTGWVFGTFVYDPNADVERAHREFGAPLGTSPWHKMMPVGVTWGNDPGIRPVSGDFNAPPERPLQQSVAAQMAPPHALRTRGWGQRMNGPIDNPLSSCMSCHGSASFLSDCRKSSAGAAAALTPSTPTRLPDDNTDRMLRLRFMRNIRGGRFVEKAPMPGLPGQLDPIGSRPGDGFDNDLLTQDGTPYRQQGLDYSLQLRIALERNVRVCK
jgi:hypothetical protein